MKLIVLNGNGKIQQKADINWKSGALFLLFVLCLFFLSANGLNALLSQNKKVTGYESIVLNQFDRLLIKTAKLEAQVKRLNSLGENLADKSDIDIQDYLLKQDPAMGGFLESSLSTSGITDSIVTKTQLKNSIDELQLELELQEQRFQILENNIGLEKNKKTSRNNSRNYKKHYSTPVKSGYVSSSFGHRRDPINGHRRHHNGIDIAAKHGSKIHTIASGFVTFVGTKGGYGKVIEITHDETLKSLYAHLSKIKVKKGQVVRKGDVIASMGQTGRATGSHLHLEVSKNGKALNPTKFIDTTLIK